MQYIEHNLTYIQRRWLTLYQQLRQRQGLLLELKTSRSGHAVPIINNKALHSLYDPLREAQKSLPQELDSCVILGLGAGYLALAALAKPTTKLVIVIEPNLELLTSLLASLDFSSLFSDPRFQLVVTNQPAVALQHLNSLYQPLLHGNLQYITARAISDLYEDFHQPFLKLWRKWLEDLSGELSTWAYFGRRWFNNIIINLSQLQPRSPTVLSKTTNVLIAGAGPSLQAALTSFKKEQAKGALVIASDAAALCLATANIPIDIILSIDAQMIVNYHFLGLEEQRALLLSDLSAAPRSPYQGDRLFFAGSHPLARLSGLPHLNTASGNVGSVAYLLAKQLGAQSIKHAGLDFAYLGGKAYAKPNYLYHEYANEAHRLKPMSHALAALTFRSTKVNYDAKSYTYQSSLLEFYQQNFQHIRQQAPAISPWQHYHIDGRAFLLTYYKELEVLPKIHGSNWHALSQKQQELVYTLLPAAVSSYQQGLDHNQVIEQHRDIALALIKQALS